MKPLEKDSGARNLAHRLFYVLCSSMVSQPSPETSYNEFHSYVAHVREVPFDLYTIEGLNLVAGLIGDPVKSDD